MTAREDYQELMEKRLNEWKTRTEQLKAGAEQLEADAKTRYRKNLALLHAKQDTAWAAFDRMKAAAESNWEQFKSNMERAGADLKAAGEHLTGQSGK